VADAIQELGRSPAQAVLVNAASFTDQSAPIARMTDLPYNTPLITCWVDGEDQAARQLGVVRYLVKPISHETLTATLAQLGDHIETVLLVDDDRQLLQLFARQLLCAERPYRVLQTTSGRRALGLLRERQPDVMVLDLGMPKMDGFQVLEQKRKDASICEIPVVVISATDPTGQPIVSHHLSVTYGSGLSATNLLACIQVISEVLSPGVQSAGQASPEKLPV
jgi:CheY-like chemotaxis protein